MTQTLLTSRLCLISFNIVNPVTEQEKYHIKQNNIVRTECAKINGAWFTITIVNDMHRSAKSMAAKKTPQYKLKPKH